jgi:hypothetical protein
MAGYERSQARQDSQAGSLRALKPGRGEVSFKVPKLRRHTLETAIIEHVRSMLPRLNGAEAKRAWLGVSVTPRPNVEGRQAIG